MILFMAVVGALIGGLTNHLAIKMLFRPHGVKYIGSWRVPFTPGLIPKRRDELAKQFGRTVVEHLLTPETFRKKLFTPDMLEKIRGYIQTAIDRTVFGQNKTLSDWVEMAGVQQLDQKAEEKLSGIIDQQFATLRSRLAEKSIRELTPIEWQEQADQKIPQITRYVLERGEAFFDSFEGRMVIKRLIDDFLESKGTLGNMIHMFFGESQTLVDKAQNEIKKFLHSPGTFELINSLVVKEWEKLKDRPVDDLIGDFDFEPALQAVKDYTTRELNISERLNQPLIHYWPAGPAWTNEHLIPIVTEMAFQKAEEKLEEALRRLKIEEMVKEQVDSFPVARLEELVLGISKREFKMITVLGALLGGLIGIVQGIIALFLG
ncbi:DUF445 domain-containing protein [Chungangia koreensis]|uniref:DUF445 domain-containing protein n=1 Tax=Chungangia koreensis TaxID=752657 RepID=A0ABV8X965_9LACT